MIFHVENMPLLQGFMSAALNFVYNFNIPSGFKMVNQSRRDDKNENIIKIALFRNNQIPKG